MLSSSHNNMANLSSSLRNRMALSLNSLSMLLLSAESRMR